MVFTRWKDNPDSEADAEEARLVRRARKGDENAFEELVRRHKDRIHFTVYRMLQDSDEAEDAVQETFIKVWRALPSVQRNVRFSSWVYRIAVNTALDRLRRQKRLAADVLDDDCLNVLSLERFRGGPREAARGNEFRLHVEQALESLPARQKAVFILRHFEGLKLREIAEVLECPLGTVKATLHHALSNLRVILTGVGEGDADTRQRGRDGAPPNAVRKTDERR